MSDNTLVEYTADKDVEASIPRTPASDDIAEAIFRIRLLHRHQSGRINFANFVGDDYVPQGSIRADELESKLPLIWGSLSKDSIFSINATYDPPRKRKGDWVSRHKVQNLRYLCAVFTDIDYHQGQSDFHAVQKLIRDEYVAGRLPRASIVADSGRGTWLFWLLHDPTDPKHAHKGAFMDNASNHIQLYATVQRAIYDRLARIGADSGATDATRHTRIPGSLHTGAEKEVSWIVDDAGTQPRSYTLLELAHFFNIKQQEKRPFKKRRRVKKVIQLSGQLQANANKLAVFDRLQELRSGFREGQRNIAASIYADILRASRVPWGDATQLVEEMGRRCEPALSRADCIRALRNSYRASYRRNYSYEGMASKLDVTVEEAMELSRITAKPFPPAVRFGGDSMSVLQARVPTRNDQRQQRHTAIQAIIQDRDGRAPSFRQMKGFLSDRGIKTSHVTVRGDYKTMGIGAKTG